MHHWTYQRCDQSKARAGQLCQRPCGMTATAPGLAAQRKSTQAKSKPSMAAIRSPPRRPPVLFLRSSAPFRPEHKGTTSALPRAFLLLSFIPESPHHNAWLCAYTTLAFGGRRKGKRSSPPGGCSYFEPAAALYSAHDRAPSLRLHRTLPAVEGGPATVRPALGSRNQARGLSADGAPGWLAGALLHPQRS